MRKILICVLCLLAFVGCAKKDDKTPTPTQPTTVETSAPTSTEPTIEKETIGVDVEGIYFETTADKGTYRLSASGQNLTITDATGTTLASGKLISEEDVEKYFKDNEGTTLNNITYIINELDGKKEIIIKVKDYDHGLYLESTAEKADLESLLANTKIYLNTLK